MDDGHVVILIVLAAAALFASDRVRMDFVAMLVVLSLAMTGILTPNQAMSGFGEPVVLLVAGLMILGEALERTGVAQSLGAFVSQVGGSSRPRVVALIMATAALLSSFMSSTAVVAIFIPICAKVARKSGIASSQLLLPMSYAAMIGGMLTLIATMPNLVVSDALVAAGHRPLGFFGFTPIGLVVLFASIGYIVARGQKVLQPHESSEPSDTQRSIQQMLSDFDLPQVLNAVRLEEPCSLIGRTLKEANLENEKSVRVLALYPNDPGGRVHEVQEPTSERLFQVGDVLVLAGEASAIDALLESPGVRRVARSSSQLQRTFQDRGVGLIMVHPNSRHLGRTIREVGLRTQHGLHVIGMQRARQRVESFTTTPLQTADILLVAGAWKCIASIAKERHDFVLLELPAEHSEARPAFRRAPLAIAALLIMVLASATNVLPTAVAVLIAAVAVIVAGCVKANEAYRAISWSSLVLLAGMLPVAIAMEKTGVTEQLAHQAVSILDGVGNYGMMATLFIMSAILSLVLSNTATAVVLAPVAIQVASSLEASPYPFAVSVLLGASAAFASPVASPVVTLVVEPGHYSIRQFLRLGLPLMIIALLVNLLLTPLLYPFQP